MSANYAAASHGKGPIRTAFTVDLDKPAWEQKGLHVSY